MGWGEDSGSEVRVMPLNLPTLISMSYNKTRDIV